MPPVEITFHTRTPREDIPGHRKVSVSPHLAKSSPLFFTFDNTHDGELRDFIKESRRQSRQKVHSATSTTPSPVPNVTVGVTKSKRAKPAHVAPPTRAASLTPLLQPIVSRCLANPSPNPTASSSSTPLPSPPGRKTPVGPNHVTTSSSAGKKKHVTPTWPVVHPYSRLTDTKNDRSTVPSPREVARAEQAERDRAKAREDSAAAARAAAALKRKKGGKRAVSKGGNQTRSASPMKDDGQAMTAEPASYDSTPAVPTNNPFPSRNGMKRTRSTGLGISTLTANIIGTGNPAVSSPLRAVMGAASDNEDEDGHTRKRSRLADTTRRANTVSPPTVAAPLPERDPIKTDPIPHAKLLAPRRASGGAPDNDAPSGHYPFPPRANSMARSDSNGSIDGAKERAKREVTLPGRLRDYDMKAAV